MARWPLVVAVLIILLAPSVPATSSATTGHLPSARVGSSATTVNDVAYIIGGRLADGNYSPDIIAYDGQMATVAGTLPRAPEATQDGEQSTASASLGGLVYVFGGAAITQAEIQPGQFSSVPVATRDIVVFDPSTGQARLTLDVLPQGTWGMAAVADGTRIYLFGGFTFNIADPSSIGRHDWVLRYDASAPEGARVSTLSDKLPIAVQDAAAGSLGTTAYLLGGLRNAAAPAFPCPSNTSVCASDAIIGFDVTTEHVLGSAGTLPQPAQFVSAARVGDALLLPGGRLQNGDVSSAVVAFDPAQGARVLSGCLAAPVFAAPVAVVAGAFLQFGGRQASLSSLTDAIVTIDPAGDPALALPGPPTSVAAVLGTDGAHVSWAAPACGASNITSYVVQRAEGTGAFIDVGSATQTSFLDASVNPNVTNAYRIAAVNAQGRGAYSTPVLLLAPPSATPPSAPLNLKATPRTGTTLATTDLAWQAPASDGGARVDHYVILRATGNGLAKEIGQSATTSFTDPHPPLARAATYVVVAVNSAGSSGPSNEARVTLLDRAVAAL